MTDTPDSEAAEPGRVRPDDVHLWHVGLDVERAVMDRLHGFLSERERERSRRFRSPADRRRYAVAHAALRQILGTCLGQEPSTLEISVRSSGKPEVAGLEFNLTHSHEVALIAVTSGRRVGVDVEYMRRLDDMDALVARFFATEEQRAYEALPPERRKEAFFRAWTRKEAVLKGLGEGLVGGLDRVSVSLAERGAQLLHRIKGSSEPWTLLDVASDSGYAAALAGEGSDWRLRRRRWVPAADAP